MKNKFNIPRKNNIYSKTIWFISLCFEFSTISSCQMKKNGSCVYSSSEIVLYIDKYVGILVFPIFCDVIYIPWLKIFLCLNFQVKIFNNSYNSIRYELVWLNIVELLSSCRSTLTTLHDLSISAYFDYSILWHIQLLLRYYRND